MLISQLQKGYKSSAIQRNHLPGTSSENADYNLSPLWEEGQNDTLIFVLGMSRRKTNVSHNEKEEVKREAFEKAETVDNNSSSQVASLQGAKRGLVFDHPTMKNLHQKSEEPESDSYDSEEYSSEESVSYYDEGDDYHSALKSIPTTTPDTTTPQPSLVTNTFFPISRLEKSLVYPTNQ